MTRWSLFLQTLSLLHSLGPYYVLRPPLLALAQVSGARLLYSNDKDLQQDFKDSRLIHPEGYVYSTLKGKELTSTHKRHLGRRDLCRIRQ